jgi:hypothetical protein
LLPNPYSLIPTHRVTDTHNGMAKKEEQQLENIIMARLVQLNGIISGLVLGVLTGTLLFLATLFLVIKGGPVVGPHLGLLGQFFWGYSVTFWGSFVGFFYGFLTGFIVGYAVAALYNFFLNLRGGENWSPE